MKSETHNFKTSKLQSTDACITINSDGVHTSDIHGNRFYFGHRQARIEMTRVYFDLAKQFWEKQTLNGQPLILRELQVQMATNSTIPYDSPAQRRDVPKSSTRPEANRVAWYNVKFENGETGWICNGLTYPNIKSAAEGLAVDTVHKIYNDKKIINCILSMVQNQK